MSDLDLSSLSLFLDLGVVGALNFSRNPLMSEAPGFAWDYDFVGAQDVVCSPGVFL